LKLARRPSSAGPHHLQNGDRAGRRRAPARSRTRACARLSSFARQRTAINQVVARRLPAGNQWVSRRPHDLASLPIRSADAQGEGAPLAAAGRANPKRTLRVPRHRGHQLARSSSRWRGAGVDVKSRRPRRRPASRRRTRRIPGGDEFWSGRIDPTATTQIWLRAAPASNTGILHQGVERAARRGAVTRLSRSARRSMPRRGRWPQDRPIFWLFHRQLFSPLAKSLGFTQIRRAGARDAICRSSRETIPQGHRDPPTEKKRRDDCARAKRAGNSSLCSLW